MNRIMPIFFTAIGVVLGGAFVGGLAALYTKDSPLRTMNTISQRLKLYAVVSSIGGTFNNLRILEGSIFQGELLTILQQLLALAAGFLGANIGVWIIKILTGGF
ncbi:MAG: YtrH family sporulation protein [Halanaerobiales bacterium]|nr:YtrH family sporulation protein [Halanaerobiales bacterium]